MSRQSQFREGSAISCVLPPNGSTRRLPVRARILKPVVPLPSDTDIPRVRKQQGYAANSRHGPSPPSLLPPNRPVLDSKAGKSALGHRPKTDPRPNARPTGMTEPLRLSSIHQTLEGTGTIAQSSKLSAYKCSRPTLTSVGAGLAQRPYTEQFHRCRFSLRLKT